jgi:hypothetical protein
MFWQNKSTRIPNYNSSFIMEKQWNGLKKVALQIPSTSGEILIKKP